MQFTQPHTSAKSREVNRKLQTLSWELKVVFIFFEGLTLAWIIEGNSTEIFLQEKIIE